MTLTERLAFRKRGLAQADAALDAAEKRLAKARADNTHPRQHLLDEAAASQKRVDKWTRLVDATTRLIARLKGADKPSLAVAAMIARFEGGVSADGLYRPYFDEHGGVWTQGHGRTRGITRNSKPVTRSTAVRWLREDLNSDSYAGAVRRACKALGLRLSQKQFDALVSLVYNAGPGQLDAAHKVGVALRRSRKSFSRSWRRLVGDAIRKSALTGAATGQVLPGLVRRRTAEAALWMGGRYA